MHDAIIQHGTDFGDTKALFNVGFYITNPLANAITNKERKWNLEYAQAEWYWYLSGDQNKILGTTVIEISGFEYLISPIQLLILLGLIILGAWIFLKIVSLILAIFRFINGDETAVSRYFDRNRERKGFRALSEGMMALASGEGSAALSKAKKAEKYLKKPSLTNLLAAQAAEIAGEAEHAEEIYKAVSYTHLTLPTKRIV